MEAERRGRCFYAYQRKGKQTINQCVSLWKEIKRRMHKDTVIHCFTAVGKKYQQLCNLKNNIRTTEQPITWVHAPTKLHIRIYCPITSCFTLGSRWLHTITTTPDNAHFTQKHFRTHLKHNGEIYQLTASTDKTRWRIMLRCLNYHSKSTTNAATIMILRQFHVCSSSKLTDLIHETCPNFAW